MTNLKKLLHNVSPCTSSKHEQYVNKLLANQITLYLWTKAARAPHSSGDLWTKAARAPHSSGDLWTKAARAPHSSGDLWTKAARAPHSSGDLWTKAARAPHSRRSVDQSS